MLASSCLGDDLGLAQPPRQKNLTNGIVDLVTSGMVQIFALQPDVGATSVLGQALGKMQLARTAHVGVVRSVLLPEAGVILDLVEALLQLGQTVHQGLGHKLPAKLAKAVGNLAVEGGQLGNHLGISVALGNDPIDMHSVRGLSCGTERLNDANFSRGLIVTPACQVGAVFFNCLDLVAVGLL